jgi:hypothetical protein
MSPRHSSIAALLAVALAVPALAAEPKLPRDGWVSWDVPAAENSPAWCCFDGWKDRDGAPRSCKLDGHINGIGTRDGEKTDTVTVYARTAGGRIDRLQVLSATCPVETNTPIQEQSVSPDESARWLIAQVRTEPRGSKPSRSFTDNALAALAMNSGDVARNGLIALGRDDAAANVRSKAWFWLAMTGAPGVESAISSALRRDPDGGVREQAVFALSRLPDERATQALIATAEDSSLAREQRKRAVFWLAQSESGTAFAYLDKILATASTRQK